MRFTPPTPTCIVARIDCITKLEHVCYCPFITLLIRHRKSFLAIDVLREVPEKLPPPPLPHDREQQMQCAKPLILHCPRWTISTDRSHRGVATCDRLHPNYQPIPTIAPRLAPTALVSALTGVAGRGAKSDRHRGSVSLSSPV